MPCVKRAGHRVAACIGVRGGLRTRTCARQIQAHRPGRGSPRRQRPLVSSARCAASGSPSRGRSQSSRRLGPRRTLTVSPAALAEPPAPCSLKVAATAPSFQAKSVPRGAIRNAGDRISGHPSLHHRPAPRCARRALPARQLPPCAACACGVRLAQASRSGGGGGGASHSSVNLRAVRRGGRGGAARQTPVAPGARPVLGTNSQKSFSK